MHTPQEKDYFLQVILQNKRIIFKICHTYCNHPSDREDLAQEIIYQLWKSGHRFNPEYKFSTWMYRVALNVAITHYRQEKKRTATISLPGDAPEVEDKLSDTVAEDKLFILHRYISRLKELDRALMLLYFEEKTQPEIAEIMGISETNVSTRLSRIKTKLKEDIANSKMK